MKEMFVQFPTFEVVRAVDKDLSKRLGDDFYQTMKSSD